MLQELLRGIAPPRPLFLPIVFSAGARVENQPLPTFLSNPTKICNALRQVRGPLRADGVSCYFDPFLEVEALGATIDWGSGDRSPEIRRAEDAEPGTLPQDLLSPEDALKASRVGVALDVISRMKAMLRDDGILMAGVTGPLTLAARLTQLEAGGAWRTQKISESALELAASMVTRISGAFAEAGANLIMILEELVPGLSRERCDAWASALEPSFNVIRFYQALPVLQLTRGESFAGNSRVILQTRWNCVLCASLDGISAQGLNKVESSFAPLGLALPLEMFQLDASARQACRESIRQLVPALRPPILTTAGDIPATTDMKRMCKVLEEIPRSYGPD